MLKKVKVRIPSRCWADEAVLTVGLTNDFRVILFIILASARGHRVIGYENSSMPSYVECNTLYCEGWGGEEGGVFPVGVIPVDNSSNIPLETLWHYGCPLFWWKWGSSRQTKGLTPKVFWEFSMSPLGTIQKKGGKKNNSFCAVKIIQHCFHRSQNSCFVRQ